MATRPSSVRQVHLGGPFELGRRPHEARVDHGQRVEDRGAERHVEPLTGHGLDHLAHPVDVHAVAPALTWIEQEGYWKPSVMFDAGSARTSA